MVITKGVKVKVLRKESYWFNQTGLVITVDQSAVKYPVLVRFEKVNYSGTNNSNFAIDELKAIENKK
jgi:photosystem I subunit 4